MIRLIFASIIILSLGACFELRNSTTSAPIWTPYQGSTPKYGLKQAFDICEARAELAAQKARDQFDQNNNAQTVVVDSLGRTVVVNQKSGPGPMSVFDRRMEAKRRAATELRFCMTEMGYQQN